MFKTFQLQENNASKWAWTYSTYWREYMWKVLIQVEREKKWGEPLGLSAVLTPVKGEQEGIRMGRVCSRLQSFSEKYQPSQCGLLKQNLPRESLASGKDGLTLTALPHLVFGWKWPRSWYGLNKNVLEDLNMQQLVLQQVFFKKIWMMHILGHQSP